jgi:hypothetical protein
MAAFVVDMISHSVVHDEITVENLTKQIAQLKSTRGKLTREFRTRKNAQEEEVSSLRMEIRELRKRVAELEASRLGMEHGIGEAAAADGSRPDILREMNDIAARQGYRRYSDSLYYMAVVMIFRSRSTYECLRNFLPLPAPNSIYDHFRDDLHASLARLKSMDQVGPYLSSQIERYPDIAKGAVLAVDAVSCSSTFVGMRTVEKSGIGSLFVVFLQPLIPTAKCCPIFIIEHPSGIGNPTIQKQIDQIAAIAHAVIYRVFIGSDGDPSYNRRHLAFFDYWNQVYEQFGLNRVLRELKQTRRVLPLGDLLHLAKNFRIRFLLFLLTFVWDEAKTTIDRERVLDICGRGPAFTDLAPLGKMRDSYPLAMTRVENILALIDNDAIAAAIALLPLSLAFNAIRLETIAKQTRTDLLRISFFIVRKVYENRVTGTDTLPETTSEEQNAEITVFHGQWTLRFINTVLDLLLCIEEYDHVGLDRVSTHPEENFFGLVRMDAHDVNTADEMERTIAHTHIVKEAQWHLGLEEHVHNRLNLAGVHIDSSAPPPITIEVGMPDNLTPDLIADICLHAVHVGPDGLAEDEALGFRNFVQYLRMLRHAAEVSARNREANHRHISGSGGQIRTHLVC